MGLWFAMLAGPLAWSAHSLASSALVSAACSVGAWPLDLITVVCELLALGGLVAAVRLPRAQLGPGGAFLVGTSLLVDGFFAVVVLIEGAPSLVLNPCAA
jgi:hypothetical protein